MRNALATFGPNSPQYLGIKSVVDEHMANAALQRLSLLSDPKEAIKNSDMNGHVMDLS